ncbi:MAG: hypothetical protein NVS9B8_18710 [Candidatus Limnocylindrales bacterium]
MVNMQLTRAEWGLVLRWVLATIIGWIVGFAICEAVVKPIVNALTHFNSDGAVIGTAIGIGQWLVLGRRINRSGWWILASILGFAVGKGVADSVAQTVPGVVGWALGGLAIGLLLGLVQWLVLHAYVREARWWILANAVAWAVGWTVIASVDPEGGTAIGLAYLIGAIGAGIAGVITAAALVWLGRIDIGASRPDG